jgi:hypothetical protein
MTGEEKTAQPGAWRDRAGFLWLESSPGRVFCYDDPARRRMGERWPSQPQAEAEREFGPLTALEQSGAPQEDRVVFLYGGGHSAEVPPAHLAVAGRGPDEDSFAEVVPGYAIALLSYGWYVVEGGEALEGVFVVVRRTGR